MSKEINLVPDIKDEMIKTLKMRNFIFFLCIVVAAASVGITLVFGLIAGGQKLAIDGKNETINQLSAKLNSYSDLGDFLTIKDQLGNISTLTSNKKVFSRTFDILLALNPAGVDTITISELSVNMADEQTTFTFDAQANANKEPFIDYNVLDAFKKSMKYTRYDYGKYVTREGDTIPAYCIVDADNNGSFFNDETRGYYAYWTIDAEGCNESKSENYNTEEYEGQKVVRIWRTPQFSEWYKETPVEGQPSMTLDGSISGVAHFESSCITYTGNDSESSANPKWTSTNDTCLLVPDGDDGIVISESSNGRNNDKELVLRFSATINLNPEIYKFSNTHVMAIAPSGRRNVTDSYVQVQAMFGERAADCAEDDVDCKSNTANGGNNG